MFSGHVIEIYWKRVTATVNRQASLNSFFSTLAWHQRKKIVWFVTRGFPTVMFLKKKESQGTGVTKCQERSDSFMGTIPLTWASKLTIRALAFAFENSSQKYFNHYF